jgi:hypothetical protein
MEKKTQEVRQITAKRIKLHPRKSIRMRAIYKGNDIKYAVIHIFTLMLWTKEEYMETPTDELTRFKVKRVGKDYVLMELETRLGMDTAWCVGLLFNSYKKSIKEDEEAKEIS